MDNVQLGCVNIKYNMEILGVIDIPLSLILTVGALFLLYLYSTWTHNYFKSRGIPGPKPYPFIGNNTDFAFVHHFHEWRQKFGNVFGFFLGREPIFVISELDMLKEIFVKSFSTFRNRRKFLLVGNPLNLGVFFLEDAAWKRVRNIITPTFSGAKLRAMCPAINDCARTLMKNFSRKMNTGESVNMKEYLGAYTMDVIARTAFSVELDSQNKADDPFTTHAKLIFTPNPIRQSMVFLASVFPFMQGLLQLIRFTFFPNKVIRFFVKNITEMIKQRQSDSRGKAEKRVDFLQMLMDAEIEEKSDDQSSVVNDTATNGHLPDKKSVHVRRLTTDEIVGQGVLFFIAGYETTASTLNFASYALANNPDVQEKAYQEIKDVLGAEEPTYDNVGSLKYLENVLLETLRLYPPAGFLHRKASETMTLQGVTLPKGSTVFIPTRSIQRDPQLFKDPEDFKPERHDEKNNPLTFLSFGYGPRICIGKRLALVEAKIALIHMIRKFKLERSADTPAYDGRRVKIALETGPQDPFPMRFSPNDRLKCVKKLTFLPVNILVPAKPNMLKLTSRD